jgi:PAS domain S-box-containing protein
LQRDGQGNPLAALETNNDITERKQAEEALRESEEQWKAAFENNPTMYFMIDEGGTVLSVNPFGAERLGYRVDELIGRSVLDVFYEADREAVQRNIASCLEQLGRSLRWELRKTRKDGGVIWVRETARAMSIKQRAVALIACEDITERKRAEEELRRSEAYLAEGQRLSHTGTLGWTVASGELYWSDETYRIFEYDCTEKPTVELVLQRTHPEDVALIKQVIDAAQHESGFGFYTGC